MMIRKKDKLEDAKEVFLLMTAFAGTATAIAYAVKAIAETKKALNEINQRED